MATLDPIANFAIVTVSQGYNNAATSIVLSTGDGSKLPSTSSVYNGTWWNATDYTNPADDPLKEIFRVIARTGDTITITRAQEGTTAQNHNTAGKTYKMIFAFSKKFRDDIENKIDGIYKSGFRATMSANQSVPTGVQTKIVFNTEAFDLAAEYDPTTNYRFTVARDGYYLFMAGAKCTGLTVDLAEYIQLSINSTDASGSEQCRHHSRVVAAEINLLVSVLKFFSAGATVGAWLEQNTGANVTVDSNPIQSYFLGFPMINPAA